MKWGVTLTALLLITGCNSRVEGKATESAQPTAADTAAKEPVAIPVEATTPQRADVSAFFETTARVQAERRVEVVPQGVGECLAVMVEEGDTVTAGQVLAELDKEDIEVQLRQTRVNINQQQNALAIAEKALAEGIGNKVERDNAQFAYEQTLATLQAQEIQLKNQTITSPIAGIVTKRNIQKGMFVTSGIPAFTVVDPSSFVLPINVPERELAHLKPGQEARVTIDSLPGQPLVARVSRISPSVDPTSGTVETLLEFGAEEQQHLREAVFARVRLVMDTHQDALVVPKDSVMEENTRKYVMVVEQQEAQDPEQPPVQVAKRVEVETGLEESEVIEVVEGITEDALVVTLGQQTLKEGTRVMITNAEQEILSRAGVSPQEALEAAGEKQMRMRHGGGRRDRMIR